MRLTKSQARLRKQFYAVGWYEDRRKPNQIDRYHIDHYYTTKKEAIRHYRRQLRDQPRYWERWPTVTKHTRCGDGSWTFARV